jgi:hypothetical protein
MKHSEIANDILATYLVGLIACDEDARQDFEYHVGCSLDWFAYSDEDREKITEILKEWVGDFTEPNR